MAHHPFLVLGLTQNQKRWNIVVTLPTVVRPLPKSITTNPVTNRRGRSDKSACKSEMTFCCRLGEPGENSSCQGHRGKTEDKDPCWREVPRKKHLDPQSKTHRCQNNSIPGILFNRPYFHPSCGGKGREVGYHS